MKRIILPVIILLTQLMAMTAWAVTDQEMEQARVITAKAYLRYANDGSGYLDEIKVTTMKELESKLRPKEKENLRTFKSVTTPRDYASWDKAKLTEYWSSTFFSSPGLIEKGKIAKARVRKNISNMKVSAPAPKTAEAEKAAAPKGDAAKPAEAAATSPDALQSSATDLSAAADSAAAADMQAKTDSLESKAVESLGVKEDENRENSYTWVYIVVLAVLVIIVAWLVSFASKVMKQRNDEQPARDFSDAPAPESTGASRELREKFAATLAAKNADIKSLTAKNESLLRENESVKRDMEALVAETGSLRTRLTEANRRVSELESAMAALAAQAESAKAAAAAATPAPAPTPEQPSVAPAPRAAAETQRQSMEPQRPAATAATPRIIYLGRANMKGIFVRADRQMNVGNSVFALETSEGYSGTFRVVSDPTVWELALMTPVESLAGACVGHDLENTADFSSIVTDSPGTAIFEDGCWKVIRKAKIHYA